MVATSRQLAGVVAASFLVLLTATAPGVAQETTGPEFAQLVERALTDESAAAVLRRIESIDGVPVDMNAVLGGDDTHRRSRLTTLQDLAGPTEFPNADATQLRGEAAQILSQPPFVGRVAEDTNLLDRIARAIGNLFSDNLASGWSLLLVIAGATALLIPAMTWLTRRRARLRRTAGSVTKPEEHETEEQEDLVAAAIRAEEEGDFDAALRLLFRSGTDDLEARGVVRNGAAASTATIRRLVRHNGDRFLDRFDEIAYGGSTAEHDDVVESRRSWTRLIERWPRP